jgi:salicylate hydroxylase
VGAALNLFPNGNSILLKLGFDLERARCVLMADWEVTDGITLERISCQSLRQAKEEYGPFTGVHRADLQTELMRLAAVGEPNGVDLHLSSRVIRVLADEACIELADGSIEHADLIIAADGLHSVSRAAVLGPSAGAATPASGLSAFRFLIPTDVLQSNTAGDELLHWKAPGSLSLLVDPVSAVKAAEQDRLIAWYACRRYASFLCSKQRHQPLQVRFLSGGSYSGTLQNFAGIHPTIDGPQPDNLEGMHRTCPIFLSR